MTDLQRYIIDEWKEEYDAGRFDRRELLRRLVLMAGGAAFVAPILRLLGLSASSAEIAEAASSPASLTAQASGIMVPPDDPTIQTESLTLTDPAGQSPPVMAYRAGPRSGGPFPGVVVIHENRGLLEHFRDVARRLAKNGYVGLAVDLLSHQGGTARFSDSAQASAALGQTPPEQLVAMANVGARRLPDLSGMRRDRIGAMGYCFGGGITWRLATQNPDLKAVAPFYGSSPPLGDVPKIKAAVLAVYAGLDDRINAGIPAIREAMQRAGVVHDIVVFPDANHGFFNDTGAIYKQDAARGAWERVLGWFERHLKTP